LLRLYFAVAFGLNWIWEIGQIFAYTTQTGDSPTKSFLFCTLAAVADAVVTVAIYWFLKLLVKLEVAKFYAGASVLGAMCAVGFGQLAFRFNLWSYGERMIVLPVIETGLLPFAQLTLLVPAAIWLAKKFKSI
jgi:hypothetical protein